MRRMFSLKQLQEIADARVEALVEGGQLDNAKPIYKHNITFYTADGVGLSFIIWNNSATELDKTAIINYLRSKENKRTMCSGAVILDGGVYFSPAFLYEASNSVFLIGVDSAGAGHSSGSNPINLATITSSITPYDDVEKIN